MCSILSYCKGKTQRVIRRTQVFFFSLPSIYHYYISILYKGLPNRSGKDVCTRVASLTVLFSRVGTRRVLELKSVRLDSNPSPTPQAEGLPPDQGCLPLPNNREEVSKNESSLFACVCPENKFHVKSDRFRDNKIQI